MIPPRVVPLQYDSVCSRVARGTALAGGDGARSTGGLEDSVRSRSSPAHTTALAPREPESCCSGLWESSPLEVLPQHPQHPDDNRRRGHALRHEVNEEEFRQAALESVEHRIDTVPR